MKFNPLLVLKRFSKVLLAGAIAGGILALTGELEKLPWYLMIAPVYTAIISALGNWLKHKWGFKVPF